MSITAGAVALRKYLETEGVSGNMFATQIGADSGMMSRWLTGTRRPSLAWAVRIEDATGVVVRLWSVIAQGHGSTMTARKRAARASSGQRGARAGAA